MTEQKPESLIPIVSDSGSDGFQGQASTIAKQNVTASLVPQKSIEDTFNGLINSDGRTSGSAVFQQLAVANMQELSAKCGNLETQLDSERDRRIEAEATIGVLKERISLEPRSKLASTALLILGPFLLSQAATISPDGEYSWNVILISAGAVSLLTGLIIQHSNFKLKSHD